MVRTLALTALIAGVTASASQAQRTQEASPDAQLHRSIQGVWRNIARVIPATTNPGDRIDPFAHIPCGHADGRAARPVDFHCEALQPDNGYRRAATAYDGRPRSRGNPRSRNCRSDGNSSRPMRGTDELAGDTVTLRAVVSKEPGDQVAGRFARLRVQLEGGILSLTPVERSEGRIAAGVTSRYARVE